MEKMNKKNQVLLLIGLIVFLIAINYSFLDNRFEEFLDTSEYAEVARIIDGDTIVTEDDVHIRLLGINTPEKGEIYYDEAKKFLNDSIFNKTIKLERVGDNIDKYGRYLRYIFLGNENINIKMIEVGFANYYFYSGRDRYSSDLEDAWKTCINSNKNLCEKSDNVCAKCINAELNYIINSCSFSCNISGWQIKGEGREKFIFNETLNSNEMAGFELDLTDSGGSLFLRDEEGKLVEWENSS